MQIKNNLNNINNFEKNVIKSVFIQIYKKKWGSTYFHLTMNKVTPNA